MSEPAFVIYMLVDPRDGWPYYVGETTDRKQRYRYHCKNTGRNLPVTRRSQEIIRAGKKPQMVTIDQAHSEVEALRKELFWIDLFMARGVKLLNREQQAWLYERYNELATSARLGRQEAAAAKPSTKRHGRPWTDEEKQRLKEAFAAGRAQLIASLAGEHQGRTRAVEMRIAKITDEKE